MEKDQFCGLSMLFRIHEAPSLKGTGGSSGRVFCLFCFGCTESSLPCSRWDLSSVKDLSSPTGLQTRVPCTGRRSHYHGTIKEVPGVGGF